MPRALKSSRISFVHLSMSMNLVMPSIVVIYIRIRGFEREWWHDHKRNGRDTDLVALEEVGVESLFGLIVFRAFGELGVVLPSYVDCRDRVWIVRKVRRVRT